MGRFPNLIPEIKVAEDKAGCHKSTRRGLTSIAMKRRKAVNKRPYDDGANKHNGGNDINVDTNDHGDEILNRNKRMKLARRKERLHLFLLCIRCKPDTPSMYDRIGVRFIIHFIG